MGNNNSQAQPSTEPRPRGRPRRSLPLPQPEPEPEPPQKPKTWNIFGRKSEGDGGTKIEKPPKIFKSAVSALQLPVAAEDKEEYINRLWNSKGRFLRSASCLQLQPQQSASNQQDNSEDKPNEEVSIEKEEEEENEAEKKVIETILSKRIRHGVLQYRIKWKDHPEEENSWEPEDKLKNYTNLLEEFNERWIAERLEKKRKNIPKPGPGRGWKKRRLSAIQFQKKQRERRAAAAENKTESDDPPNNQEPLSEADQKNQKYLNRRGQILEEIIGDSDGDGDLSEDMSSDDDRND